MKKKLILLSALFLIGITQINAQCYKRTDIKAQTENATKLEGKTLKLKITEINCTGCSNYISNSLKAVVGIIEHKVEFSSNLTNIQFNQQKHKHKMLLKKITIKI